MEVGVVTVTYGNRIEYLSKLIRRLEYIQVKKICVVVNESSKNIFDSLLTSEKVKFIFNDENLGSAKGFKQGIEYFISELEIDFLWLLDDDNLPQSDALEKIIVHYNKTDFNNNKDALLSYRPDRPKYLAAVKTNNGALMLAGKNSALGFSIFGKNKQYFDYPKKGLMVAPYGGLFFNKNLINSIGFPDEDYYLYGDDYDFTIRISKNGGRIMLVKDSVVKDMETSFHLKDKKFFGTRYYNTDNLDKIYFSVRNGIIFELKYLADKKWIYYINLFIYSSIIGVLLLFYPKKFITFYRAIYNSTIKNG